MPKVGEIVNYVLDDRSPSAGEIRPAIVVTVFTESTVCLQLFVDGAHDLPGLRRAQGGRELLDLLWCRSVVRDDGYAPGTWHPVASIADAPQATPDASAKPSKGSK